MTLERIEARWPALIPALRDHPGIGFLLVRSERHGAVVIGPRGVNYLDEGAGGGRGPARALRARTPRGTSRRTDGFPHCPDIVVNSTYWAETDEVAAFEELVGSHGGMGGAQSFPFALVAGGVARPRGAGGRRRDDARATSAAGWPTWATTAYRERQEVTA